MALPREVEDQLYEVVDTARKFVEVFDTGEAYAEALGDLADAMGKLADMTADPELPTAKMKEPGKEGEGDGSGND